MVRLVYPEIKSVSDDVILKQHAEAIAKGLVSSLRKTEDVRRAICDLEDVGLVRAA